MIGKPFDIKTSDKVAAIAMLLVGEQSSVKKLPYKNTLKQELLDYSLNSLRHLDKYLNKVRRNLKSLTDEQYSLVILRCGAYCGEVIRKNSKISFEWITNEEALEIDKKIEVFGRSLSTAFVLIDKDQKLTFPMGKVEKFLQDGPTESLYFYATVIGKFS